MTRRTRSPAETRLPVIIRFPYPSGMHLVRFSFISCIPSPVTELIQHGVTYFFICEIRKDFSSCSYVSALLSTGITGVFFSLKYRNQSSSSFISLPEKRIHCICFGLPVSFSPCGELQVPPISKSRRINEYTGTQRINFHGLIYRIRSCSCNICHNGNFLAGKSVDKRRFTTVCFPKIPMCRRFAEGVSFNVTAVEFRPF